MEVIVAAVKTVSYGSALAAAGAAVFPPMFALAGPVGLRVARREARFAAALGLAAALAQYVLQSYALSGDWSLALSSDFLAIVADGPAGRSMLLRAAALGLLLVVAPIAPLALVAAAAAVLSFVFAGHSARVGPLVQAVLFLHLSGVACWVGALWPLRRLTREDASLAAPVMERFGRFALAFVGGLITAGIVLALFMFDAPVELVATGYGRLFSAKLLLVAALLGFAAANKLRLTPALLRGEPRAHAWLRRSITFEMVLVVVILGLTASFTTFTGAPGL